MKLLFYKLLSNFSEVCNDGSTIEHICQICNRAFRNARTLKKHLPLHSKSTAMVQCPKCQKEVTPAHYQRHIRSCSHKCSKCDFSHIDDEESWIIHSKLKRFQRWYTNYNGPIISSLTPDDYFCIEENLNRFNQTKTGSKVKVQPNLELTLAEYFEMVVPKVRTYNQRIYNNRKEQYQLRKDKELVKKIRPTMSLAHLSCLQSV